MIHNDTTCYNPLPITPPTTSHPRRRRQGPLDNTWRSLHCHRRCRRRRHPPSPSLSATTAIIAIMGLVVAWCRLPPPSFSSLPSNATTTPSTTKSPPPAILPLPVAVAPSVPSRSPMAPSWTGMQRQCPPVRRGEGAAPARASLVKRRAKSASAAVMAAAMPRSPFRWPALDPPLLLGPPPPVGRW